MLKRITQLLARFFAKLVNSFGQSINVVHPLDNQLGHLLSLILINVVHPLGDQKLELFSLSVYPLGKAPQLAAELLQPIQLGRHDTRVRPPPLPRVCQAAHSMWLLRCGLDPGAVADDV